MITTKNLWLDICLVLAGGAMGSVLRYFISRLTYHYHETSSPFPFATFVVNMLGCFLVGWILIKFQSRQLGSVYRIFFITGFMGAFTTFSAFSLDTMTLINNGHFRTAAMNIFASMAGGISAILAGMYISLKL